MKNIKSQSTVNHIVWAIDPHEKTMPDKYLLQKLNYWFFTGGFRIRPAYVLPLESSKIGEFPEEARLSNAIESAEEEVDKYIQSFAIPVSLTTVLPVHSSGRKSEVEEILDFAKKQEAHCLMLSSHGRSGVSRLLLGSFAETVLARATCPVFFLPDSHLKSSESHKGPLSAFFATDFSDLSKKAFDNFLEDSRSLDLNIILFHSVSLPAIALEGGYGVPVTIPENYFSTQVEWARKKGKEWIQNAEATGANVKLVVRDSGIGSDIAQVILHTAQAEGADIIIMTTTSTENRSFFLGSVAREVFRSRTFPVWVYGPHSLASLEGSLPKQVHANEHRATK